MPLRRWLARTFSMNGSDASHVDAHLTWQTEIPLIWIALTTLQQLQYCCLQAQKHLISLRFTLRYERGFPVIIRLGERPESTSAPIKPIRETKKMEDANHKLCATMSLNRSRENLADYCNCDFFPDLEVRPKNRTGCDYFVATIMVHLSRVRDFCFTQTSRSLT